MVGCSVLGCKSRSERKISGITFHSFPSNPNTKLKWLSATGRQNWQPTKYSKICSIHFGDEAFNLQKKLVQLKTNSVPIKHIHIVSSADQLLKTQQENVPLSQPSRSNIFFPRDVNRRRTWLTLVPLKGKFNDSSKICSLHFKPEDYEPDRPGHLQKKAIPYYFPHSCDCASAKNCSMDHIDIEPVAAHTPNGSISPSQDSQPQSSQPIVQTFHNYPESQPSENLTCSMVLFNIEPEEHTANSSISPSEDSLPGFPRDIVQRIPSTFEDQWSDSTLSVDKHDIEPKAEHKTNGLISFSKNPPPGSSQDIQTALHNSEHQPRKSLLLEALTSKSTLSSRLDSPRDFSQQTVQRIPRFREFRAKDSILMDRSQSPTKRPCLKDFNVQVKIKTPRERYLEKKVKVLQQKISRQAKKINSMKSIYIINV